MKRICSKLLIFMFCNICFFISPLDAFSADKVLEINDLSYLGSFKLPEGTYGCADAQKCSFGYAGRGLGYNPDNNSLYVFGHVYHGYLAEVSIPTLVNSSNLSNLNTASVLQNFTDVWSGTLGYLGSGGSYVENGAQSGGVLYNGAKLAISQWAYYDGGYDAVLSHATVNSDWSNALGFSGMKTVGATSASTVAQNAGYMTWIPESWQSSMGGTALTGQAMIAIIERTSVGPSAWVFNPDDVGVKNPAPATQVVGYPSGHWTLGAYSQSNSNIGGADQITGVVWPTGSKTILFFGMHGDTYCYGTGADCGDPADSDKGVHGYPYHTSIWAYSADDLLSVKNGTSNPWDLSPLWRANIENDLNGLIQSKNTLLGAAYDGVNQIIYVSAEKGDDSRPVIHAYKVNLAAGQDTSSPVISNGSPTGTLASGTTQATLSVTTNESATCRYGTSSGVAYSSMPNTFSTTGGTSHSTTITGLTEGGGYTRYVRCIDGTGNANTTDYSVNWTVSSGGGSIINVANLSELYAAFDGEQDGDEIVIASGTYTLNTTALSIDADNITVRSATGNRDDVVIQGDAMTSDATIKSIFYFPQGAYGQNATIKDLTVGRVGWHAVFFNGDGSGNGTTIDNVRIFNTYEQMIKGAVVTSGTSNVTIKNCLFEFTSPPLNYYTGGIDAHSPDGWVIQDNVFKNIQSPSGSVAEHAIHLWENDSFSGSNLIERNQIIDCDRGIGVWHNSGVATIRNNMVTSSGTGTFPDVGIDIQDSQGTLVYNNTVWIDPSGYYAAMEVRDTTTTGVVLANNLTNKEIAIFSGVGATKTTNVENAQTSWFTSTATGDLHLSNSVASVTGLGITMTGLIDDFDGDARSGSIDIGADQQNQYILPPPNVKIN